MDPVEVQTGGGSGVPLVPSLSGAGGAGTDPTGWRVAWGRAATYGLGFALLGGLIWGILAAATGLVFTLAAVGIGLAIAWGVSKGAGCVTTGVIVLGVGLTLLAVFVGDIVAYSIVLADSGFSPLDVLASYPRIVALAPLETSLAYLFGLVGAGFAAFSLWQEREGPWVAPPRIKIAPNVSSAETPGPVPPSASIQRGAYDVRMQVTLPPPGDHRLVAAYSMMSSLGRVCVDEQEVAVVHVWGLKEEVPVPLPEPSQRVVVRFRSEGPHINVLVDGQVYAAG